MRPYTCLLLALSVSGFAEIREHPGGKILPHDEYIRVVSEKVSPVEHLYIQSKDGLIHMDRMFHDLLDAAGKSVRLEIFENGYHDFIAGPQGHEGRDEPLMDATLAALEMSIEFARKGE